MKYILRPKVEELRQEKLEIDQQLRTIHGPDRGEYRDDYRGVGRDHRGSYDSDNYHRQSHEYRDSYHSTGGPNRRDHMEGYQRSSGSGHHGGYRDHQGKKLQYFLMKTSLLHLLRANNGLEY